MSEANREFLFSYHFGGKTWGTSVFAADEAEAREKIKAVGMARLDGECMGRIHAAVPGAGLLTRLIVWWQNLKVEQKR